MVRRRSLLLKLVLLAVAVWLGVMLLASWRAVHPYQESGVQDAPQRHPLHAPQPQPPDLPFQPQNLWWKDKQKEPIQQPQMKQLLPESNKEVKGTQEEDKMDYKKVQDSNIQAPDNQPAEPPFDPKDPGEQGRGVDIDKKALSPEDLKKFEDGWQKNAFNDFASKRISLHRSLPDYRDPECLKFKYLPNPPSTSVILCFHNEAWSVLLRSVHSILDRSPPHLIKEIILVDDYSNMDHLKEPLHEYVDKLKKVRVVRTKRREGLIRARLLGASVANGEVLTFLDSHIECAKGWLEPLLDRVARNWSNVAVPVIDIIKDDTLQFIGSDAHAVQVGGFDWNLQFNWHPVPERENARRKSRAEPVRTPTMAGGLFTISRKYFEYLGTYDPGFDIWGGENLELSFKIWTCGGNMEIIPCSHVGHIFRKRSPYSWGNTGNVVKKNSVRLAEVWLDDYKKLYYMRFNFDLGDYGDISARKSLRTRLQCKSFKWYLDNIFPELFIPTSAVAHGEIRNKARPMCVDAPTSKRDLEKPIKMWPCHKQGGNQFWMLSNQGEIRRDETCMDYSGRGSIITYTCHGGKGNQEWEYNKDGTVRHRLHGSCMEMSPDGNQLVMAACTGIDRQIWLWSREKLEVDKLQL